MEFIPVLLDSEIRNGPHDLPQKVNDRGDVKELYSQRFLTYIYNFESGLPRVSDGNFRVSPVANWLCSHDEICEFSIRARPDLLRKIRRSGSQDTSYLGPINDCWMSTHHKIK
jgi:hypothetical protein